MLSVPRTPLRRFIATSLSQRRFYAAPSDRADPPNKVKYIPTKGTYPKGFLAGSAHAGVKASNTKFDDLALVASETPCSAACVFTQNVFKAAPVQVSGRILGSNSGEGIQSIVVNSGCANAVTGKGGLEDAIEMVKKTDNMFGHVYESLTPDETDFASLKSLVMSTGVIGQRYANQLNLKSALRLIKYRLPISKILDNIPALHASLGNTHDHWLRTARAICTTDTFPKLVSRTFSLPSHPATTYSIAGMTKGAGMIHPNMATLLSMITTDAAINPSALRCLLQAATETSFNSISIDGDTSTNDTCAILANGAAAPAEHFENPIRVKASRELNPKTGRQFFPRITGKYLQDQSEDYRALHAVLVDFMADLAKLVVRDGEGATKFVTVRVEGATSNHAAKRIANSIVRSPLVKTALYGKDANWGRILCAIGYAPGRNQISPKYTSVSFIPADGSPELKLLVCGEPEQVDEERAAKILESEDLEILVRLDDGQGTGRPQLGRATMWTCDFSHEYVTINGDYRT